ncbi:MAG: D-alanyl-D-alanine carboxypeptidase/D-alanyl-D-alanine-endopeptidase, partial [Bacteroidota bacterium]
MKKFIFLFFLLNTFIISFAQETSDKLNKAMEKFLADPALKHAITGFYVMNAGTGKIIYNLNGEAGLAPGSTQKIYTSIAAFDLLGNDFQFETDFGYAGNIDNNTLNGNLIISGSGDPSFGSSRFPKSIPTQIFSRFLNTLNQSNIKEINGNILVQATSPEIPGAWIWEDLGNYYGAASSGLNWRENEYDLHLRSGKKIGERVSIISINNDTAFPIEFDNEVTTAEIGTGDQSYIYLPFNSSKYLIRGTIPVDENNFIVHGAVKDPAGYFVYDLQKYMRGKINFTQQNSDNSINDNRDTSFQILYKYFSPSLDSLTYFFLQKSINLYGEAFLQKIAALNKKSSTTETGILALQKFWENKGIEKSALNIFDGSGLSPQNRVTPASMVYALQYAKSQNWFSSFYKALPEYNNIKMKSGTIADVKAFAGYITSKDGNNYTFAFIVNNYD